VEPPQGSAGRRCLRRNDLDRGEHRLIMGGGEAGGISGQLPGAQRLLVVCR
jgi:hypothetical protein